MLERFSDRREVVSINYAGCSNSTIPEGDLSLDILVEQVASAIRHASSGPVDLLGDSLGAVVSAATAARHPDLVRRLVLIAGWANSGDPRHQLIFSTWARLEAQDSELGMRYGLSLALTPSFVTSLGHENIEEIIAQKPPAHTIRRIEFALRVDIHEEVKKITAPTLIIRGQHDFMIPEYQTRVLHEAIAGSEYVALESGHGVLLERPNEVVALVRKFLLET
ncbi:alpha/beta hydrolase [Pendulispora brunnea]|uniref:Alpha/beta hydrolase n=1 Tax=Pendulispora brunnea TaxID=2905690 RepID=A0ABZ2K2D1_9BACT